MDLGAFLPKQSVEDLIAKRVRVTIGGAEYTLAVKSIRDHREWEERLDVELVWLLNTVRDSDTDASGVLAALSASPGRFIDLLLSYDAGNVLPDRDTIEEIETEMGVLLAVLEVWRAAHPLAATGIETFGTMARPMHVLPELTSSLPPSGDGHTPTSRTN